MTKKKAKVEGDCLLCGRGEHPGRSCASLDKPKRKKVKGKRRMYLSKDTDGWCDLHFKKPPPPRRLSGGRMEFAAGIVSIDSSCPAGRFLRLLMKQVPSSKCVRVNVIIEEA